MRRRLGDRRGRPRFDIVGELPGSLETVLRLPLENISPGGALIQSHVALPAESVHTLRLIAAGEAFTTQVRVKHVKSVTTSDGERTFLLGVEFVAAHPALLGMIDKYRATVSGDSEQAGV